MEKLKLKVPAFYYFQLEERVEVPESNNVHIMINKYGPVKIINNHSIYLLLSIAPKTSPCLLKSVHFVALISLVPTWKFSFNLRKI